MTLRPLTKQEEEQAVNRAKGLLALQEEAFQTTVETAYLRVYSRYEEKLKELAQQTDKFSELQKEFIEKMRMNTEKINNSIQQSEEINAENAAQSIQVIAILYDELAGTSVQFENHHEAFSILREPIYQIYKEAWQWRVALETIQQEKVSEFTTVKLNNFEVLSSFMAQLCATVDAFITNADDMVRVATSNRNILK